MRILHFIRRWYSKGKTKIYDEENMHEWQTTNENPFGKNQKEKTWFAINSKHRFVIYLL